MLALVLSVGIVCFGQDASQNPATKTVIKYDEKGEPLAVQAPADANQTAPAGAPSEEAAAESGKVATSVAVVVAGKAEPNQEGAQESVLTPLQQRMKKTISVEFRETPIADVIRQLAQQADVDIIMSPKVVGNVTATLTDVPLDEALNNILAVHGAAYIAGKNMIRVVPIGELTVEQAKLETRVYRIMYANVKDVAAALEKYISKSGQISYSVGTSNIIVTDTEDKIKAIDMFIKEIDRITPQVLVEARLYDMSSDNRLDLGIQWFAGRNTDFGAGVLGGTDKTGATSPFVTGIVNSSTNFTAPGTTNTQQIRFGILNDDLDIDAIIKATQRDIAAKLLANPRVLVLDNETADIKIVQEIPYQELSQTSGGGNIGTTQFKDVGVELMVTPHVTENGLMRLHIVPKFSNQVATFHLAVPGTDQTSDVPVVDKREADTIALVKDGQTVVIGGLLQNTAHKDISKVPLLGDIPIVGLLFRFNGEDNVNSELVVFIKPRIVVAPALSPREDNVLQQTEIPPPTQPGKSILGELKKY
jgi:type IV pilus assembly protein PilQ